ncbi:hypothetical protein MTR67_003370 [Solanum verrucosum]|uniref:Uncharacterized protein n=1 Tax=Solanum verrucosum TaxID=315347 RepID=A0AAF0PU67_SOLVR|nr:hypothetical protein MTR67_003365 [Solanum verrucosum]WMV09985.1 hypothetical protein MTR67_003370 [Solanum verrucosum]
MRRYPLRYLIVKFAS